MKSPLKDSKGETVICRTKGNGVPSECPDGYKCNHLPFFSICCEQKNEGLFIVFNLLLFQAIIKVNCDDFHFCFY